MTARTRSIKCVIVSLHAAHRLKTPMAMEAVRMDVSTRDCPDSVGFIFPSCFNGFGEGVEVNVEQIETGHFQNACPP